MADSPDQVTTTGAPRILVFSTQGSGGSDEARITTLLRSLPVECLPFHAESRGAKFKSFLDVLKRVVETKPDLIIMEGTGVAGGAALLMARCFGGIRYAFSSGDAVAPFLGARYPWLTPIAALYERLLCRFSSGFVGWTPYLVGRALTCGAPRGVTLPGWAPFTLSSETREAHRTRIREQLGIPPDAIVIGIAGSLAWNQRFEFCYGADLVRAIRRLHRKDVVALIVGDGEGRGRLERLAGALLGSRIFLPGGVPREQVPEYLSAMDIGSLPQSVDGVGCFRYTTKLSEYLAAGLPVVTGEIPMAYDLDEGWLWRIPGRFPWSEKYVESLRQWMDALSAEDILWKQDAVPRAHTLFSQELQARRAAAFFRELLASLRKS